MVITQENIEKLNVGDYPGARLCKGLLLDAIEAGDKLEARVNELERENAKLKCLTLHALSQLFKIRMENYFCIANEWINRNAREKLRLMANQYNALFKKADEAYRKANQGGNIE